MTSTDERSSSSRKPRKFDTVELLTISGLAFLLALVIGLNVPRWRAAPEIGWFAQKYGPEHSSQFGEEWIIRDYFQDKRGGTFVDVGANHYQRSSTTYFLESRLGWSGLAVEPLREFQPDYAKYRPRTKFLPFFVSDASNEQARIYVLDRLSAVTSADRAFTERHGSNAKEISVPTITMNDLLEAERMRAFDFLSMDIELSEPKALAGFDIERFRPSLVCIEAHPEVRQQILDYFAQHRYALVGKYLRADDNNLYFAPFDQKQSRP